MANFPQSGVQLVAEGSAAFIDALRDADNAVDAFGRNAEKAGGGVSAFGEVVTGALRHVGTLAVDAMAQAGQAIGSFLIDSVSLAGDFEGALNNLSSVAGDSMSAAGLSLDDFRAKALQLGADTAYSAGEALDAMTELAKGGVAIADVMGGATDATLNLAAAGELDLAPAADIVAKALGVWGRYGVDATEVTDLLAQAANASTVNVQELADGMANAQGRAAAMGVEYRDFTTAMALIAPSFSSAQEAGTSYNNFLARLIPTTDAATMTMIDLGLMTEEGTNKFFDATGAFVGNQAAAQMLQDALGGLTEQQRVQALQTLFGNDGMGAAVALMSEGSAGYAEMSAAMDAAGTAAEQAAERNQGLNKALDAMKGSIETVQIVLGSLLIPILTDLVTNAVTPAINAFGELATTGQISGEAIGALPGYLQPAFIGLQMVVDAVTAAAAAFSSGGLDAGIASLAQSFGMSGEQAQAFAGVISGAIQTAIGIIQGLAAMTQSVLAGVAGFWAQYGGQITATATQTFGAIQSFIAQVMPGIQAVVSAVLGQIATFWANNGAQITAAVVQAWQTIQTIIQGVMGVLGPIISAGLTTIAGFITSHGAQIQSLFTNTWNAINALVTGVLALINGVVQAALALLQGDTEGAMEAVKDAFATAWESIQTIFSSALDNLITILDIATGNFVSGAIEIGQGIISGITSAIQAGANQIIDSLVNLASQAIDQVKAALGITSPSTVFAEQVGEPIALGIAEGIAAQTDAVIAAGTSVAQSLLDAMETMDEEAKKQAEETADAILTELERLAEKSAALMERIIGDVLSGSAGLSRGGARASSLFGSLYPDSGDIAKAEKAIKDAQKRIGDLSTPTARRKSEAAEDLADIAAERTLLEWTVRNNDSLEKREQARQKLLDLNKKESNLRDKIAAEEADYQVKEQARLGKLKEAQDALTLAQGQQAEAQQKYAEQAEIAGKARDDLTQAEAEAQELAKTDPKLAADFLDLRVRQIGELAKLERQAAAAATSDEAERYRTQITFIRQAQQFETATFQQNAAKRAADMAAFAADAQTTGDAMIDGMVAGIQQSAGALEQAMVDAVSRALAGVRRQFGITSPSLVWAEQVGVPLMEGVGAGVFAALPSVEATIGRAMGQLTGATRVQPANASTYNQQSYIANNGGNTININGTSMSQSQLISLVAKAMDGAGAKADIRGRTGSR